MSLKVFSTKVKELCYKTLVRPVMDYASCVWDPSTKINIEKIKMVQWHAAHFVKGDYDRTSSVTAMLNKLGWEDTSAEKTTGQGRDVVPNSTWAGCCPSYSILDPSGIDRYNRARNETLSNSQRSMPTCIPSSPVPWGYGTSCNSRLYQRPA